VLVVLLACGSELQSEEQKKCSGTREQCERAIRDMLTGQKYLGVEFANTRTGAVVTSIMPSSPAEATGLRAGDAVVAIEGHSATRMRVRAIKEHIEAAKQRGRVMMALRRSGTPILVNIPFAVMQKDQIDRIVAAHFKEAHSHPK